MVVWGVKRARCCLEKKELTIVQSWLLLLLSGIIFERVGLRKQHKNLLGMCPPADHKNVFAANIYR